MVSSFAAIRTFPFEWVVILFLFKDFPFPLSKYINTHLVILNLSSQDELTLLESALDLFQTALKRLNPLEDAKA